MSIFFFSLFLDQSGIAVITGWIEFNYLFTNLMK